jgi:diguanylate cyclase (GGDEF)-like protein
MRAEGAIVEAELKILMLEDVPEEAELVQRELHKAGLEFVARRVQTRAAFAESLEQFAPDLVLADSKLPAFDGRVALQMVRQRDPLLPVIMVTGALGDEAAVELLIAGASDYVLKDRLARLGPAVQRALREKAMTRERQEAEQRIRYLAYFDPITDLANRTQFCDRVARLIEQPANSVGGLVVAAFNVQCLSRVNDSFGRQMGDVLLQCVADRLRERFDGSERIAHLGGGAFAAVIPCGAAAAEDRIQEAFAQPLIVRGREIRAPVKCGLARFPADGASAETLVQNAEVALHAARSGPASYCYYREQMTSGPAERLALEHRLRRALDRGEFVLYYQPQICRRDRHIVGVEALLRWQDPQRGLIGPVEFLPVLESTGLIFRVGEWVLSQAAEDCRRWRRLDLPPVRVAVNVSTLELSQPGLAGRLLRLAGARGDSRVDLDIEITEGELLQDLASVTELLQQLRAAGVRVAIDDFGTGFSSLSRLSDLPIDILKIDCSFVRRLTPDRATHAIVSTIIALARSYNLDTVAEGVETPGQLEILTTLGCETSQGYLHSPAVAAETIEQMLRAARHNGGAYEH